MDLSPQEIKQFQTRIFDWYKVNKRDLPWRQIPFDTTLHQRDPYEILLSEVMAQQTQISRVILKYESWLEAFPTIQDLAKASVSNILVYWTGLGYNRRALNLKKTAEIIVNQYDGKFPREESELLKLPGIGQYTARALLCFGFNEQIAVVDTNIRKVILTQFINSHPGEAKTSIGSHSKIDSIASLQNDINEIQKIADQLLPQGRAYEWNQALMDYASAVLKKEKIDIPKQSKFKGSHRYYRGQVLKKLIEKKKISLPELGGLIKKDYDEVWLQSLVSELRDEGFVELDGKVVKLSS